MELLKPQAALLALGLWACADAPPEKAAVLARVGQAEISERDFAAALEKLPTGSEAQPLADWRRQLQALIDKELLLLEARAQGLDEAVADAMAAWERKELVEQLLVREQGEQLAYTETELAEFFAESGAGREIRLRRLRVGDQATAMEMLRKAQNGAELAGEWSESGWLNALNAGDVRTAALFLQEVGNVELVETDGHYLLITIAAEREVSLADRRPLVEAALTRHKKRQANLAYLEQLTSQYAVQLDTAALRQVAAGAAAPEMRLVRSAAGDWSTADYQQALVRLGADAELLTSAKLSRAAESPTDVSALSFKVTRAFVADQILPQEAHKHGLYAELESRRNKACEQKLIQALWEREIFAHIQIDPAQVRTFYEANAQRYARSGAVGRALQAQVVRDLRDAQAAPLFDRYIEQLREKYAAVVAVEEEQFGEFVSQRRQAANPVEL